jgi:ribosome maturation factor RimP
MEELLQSSDHFVVDVVVRGRSGSMVVEVYLDGDHGIGIRDLASYSRELGFVLEAEDVIRGKYHLNVSSPGEERSLVLPRQFPRHKGRDLEIVLGEGEAAETTEGKHAGMDDDGRLILETAKETRKIDLASISRARIKLPW